MQGKTCAILEGDASGFREETAMTVRTWLHDTPEIPDLSIGEWLYEDFGLTGRPARDETVHLYPTQLPRKCFLLYPGPPKKRLHHIVFGAPRDDFAQVEEASQHAGLREVDPPTARVDGGH
jgi:hypothetical protein